MVLYVQAEAFKNSTSLSGYSFADPDVQSALGAASRAVETATHRKRFDKDETPVTRAFTARSSCLVAIGDIAQIDEVTVQGAEVTDYIAEPLNAIEDGRPYTMLTSDSGVFWTGRRAAVEVTGLWGWPAVPDEVVQMTTILASRLLKRSREAPFGVLTAGGLEGIAVKLAQSDPEMRMLIAPLTRQLVGWR